MGKVNFFYKGKKFEADFKKASLINKAVGLMFKGKNTKNLFFSFPKDKNYSLHSFFVFFDFLILWLDENNNVIDFYSAKPFEFHISSEKRYRKILEIPFNSENKNIIDFFVGKRKI